MDETIKKEIEAQSMRNMKIYIPFFESLRPDQLQLGTKKEVVITK